MTAHRHRPWATGLTIACGTLAVALFAIGCVPPALGRGDPLYAAWAFSLQRACWPVAAAFAVRERRLVTLVGVAGAIVVLGYFVIALRNLNSF